MSDYDVAAAFERIESELIDSMMRNMARHRDWEDAEGFHWSMWQAEQLRSLERYRQQNRQRYGEQFRGLNAEIRQLILRANEVGGTSQEKAILRAIQKGFVPHPRGSRLSGQFFRLNERKLEALIQATTKDMERAETAILRMADDQYRKAIFNAQVYANAGGTTYEKAVDMATKDMLSSGLNCVEYKNGARHTLHDYADMAIRTANKRAYLQGEGAKRHEWGISTVILNKRGNPCPKCLPWAGKVLIDDVWSGGSQKDGKYPLMSYAISKGLYHPRCKDSHTTYFPGISTADDTWTKEELEAIEAGGQKESRQYYINRQITKYKNLTKYSLDPDNKEKYKKLLNKWSGERKNGIMDNSITETAIQGLPAIGTLQDNTGRKAFARELIDRLPIDKSNTNVSVRKIPSRGHCAFRRNAATCDYYEYVLQSDDNRSEVYKAKTAFHEAYHLSLHGRKWDALDSKGVSAKWLDIEETFAECASHYAVKVLGVNDQISPSYASKLIRTLPRLKRTNEFASCVKIEDFGRIAWKERTEGRGGVWGNLHDKIFGIPFDEEAYFKQYFKYMSDNKDELFAKMYENSPSFKVYQNSMEKDLEAAMKHFENGGTLAGLSSNQAMVFSDILINAMLQEGVK